MASLRNSESILAHVSRCGTVSSSTRWDRASHPRAAIGVHIRGEYTYDIVYSRTTARIRIVRSTRRPVGVRGMAGGGAGLGCGAADRRLQEHEQVGRHHVSQKVDGHNLHLCADSRRPAVYLAANALLLGSRLRGSDE